MAGELKPLVENGSENESIRSETSWRNLSCQRLEFLVSTLRRKAGLYATVSYSQSIRTRRCFRYWVLPTVGTARPLLVCRICGAGSRFILARALTSAKWGEKRTI